MYMFSVVKGFQGTLSTLRNLLPNRSNSYYYKLDFLIVAIAGSIIGTIFFRPQDPLQALAAGLSWFGALSVLAKQNQPPPSEEQSTGGSK